MPINPRLVRGSMPKLFSALPVNEFAQAIAISTMANILSTQTRCFIHCFTKIIFPDIYIFNSINRLSYNTFANISVIIHKILFYWLSAFSFCWWHKVAYFSQLKISFLLHRWLIVGPHFISFNLAISCSPDDIHEKRAVNKAGLFWTEEVICRHNERQSNDNGNTR